MDKILEYINKNSNNNYTQLTFESAIYNAQTGTMQLTFKVPKSVENTNEIEVLCKNFLSDITDKITFKFLPYTFTIQDFKNAIKEIVKNNQNLISINSNDISISFEKDITNITIPYFENSLEDEVIHSEKINLENEINNSLNCNCNVEFDKVKQLQSDILELRKAKMYEDNMIVEELANSQIVKFNVTQEVYGNIDDEVAHIAGNLNFDSGNITVVGKLKSIEKKEFKSKSEQEETKSYYAIEIEHEGQSTRGVFFPPKNFEEPNISVGTELAIQGTISEFKGRRDLRIKAFAYCNYEKPKQVWRKIPKEYRHIRPEKYEFFEQSNFFAVIEETKKEYLKNNTFVVYDLETTGINTDVCKIIDIGAFKIVNGKIVEKFATFINPKEPIPAEASKVNHITDEMVADMPSIDDVLPDFLKFCEGSIILGYNNIAFDDLFIKREGKRLLYNFENPKDDVIRLARNKIKGLKNYKLATVCNHMGVQLIDAHRATNDALATAKLFIKLVENFD